MENWGEVKGFWKLIWRRLEFEGNLKDLDGKFGFFWCRLNDG